MKVEKAQYANKNNAFRINQAENKLKQIPEINEKTEQEKFKIQSENGFQIYLVDRSYSTGQSW